MPDLKAIEEAVEGLLGQEAAELVDLRYLQEGGRWVLRVYVDKHGGVTLDDCERYSEKVGALLDAMDAMEHSYTLEVSSPGVDRILKKQKDFSRFSGHRVKLRLKAPLEGRRRFHGVLRGVEDGRVVLESDGQVFRLAPEAIEEARLDPEIVF